MPYRYEIKNIRVIDGDTLSADILVGFSIVLENQLIRLKGIDTPESKTKDLEEKKYGLLAKDRLAQLVKNEVILVSAKGSKDKYGRISADLELCDGRCVSQILIDEHLAVAYDGSSKEAIKEAHLINRKILEEIDNANEIQSSIST